MPYSKEKMSELYGQAYNGEGRFGDRPGGFLKYHWRNKKRWEYIASDIIQLTSPSSILEIGCGRGSLVQELREQGVNTVGIDISEWSISNPISPKVQPYISHLAAQDLSDKNHYDLIVALDVIEHLPYDFYDDFFPVLQRISPSLITTLPLTEVPLRRTSEETCEHYVADTQQGWREEFLRRGYDAIEFSPTSHFPFDKKNSHNYPFIFSVI